MMTKKLIFQYGEFIEQNNSPKPVKIEKIKYIDDWLLRNLSKL